MPQINQLSSVNLRDLIGRTENKKAVDQSGESGNKDFGDMISDFLQAVNTDQGEATQKVADVIQGRSQNLHEAMATLEEAKLSFQLMLEIRNRLLESYQELQRTQI